MKHKLQNLLKHKQQWLMLLAALFGVSQGMWAGRTFVANEYFYLYNATGYVDQNGISMGSNAWILSSGCGWLYVWNSSGSHSYKFELISGTAGSSTAVYGAKVTNAGTYDNFIITRNSSSSTGPWNNKLNQSGDLSFSGTKNYIKKTTAATTVTLGYYARTPSSCTISLGGSHSGSGTSVDPYIVEPEESLTFTITATQADPGMTGIGASVNTNSSKEANAASTSVTVTKTASASNSKDENWTGYAWAYKYSISYYSDSYTTSSDKVYTRTAAACTPPDAPEDVEADPSEICAGESTTLSASVGEGCTVKWYTVSTGGTPLASSTVSPAETATYYAEADNGSCASTTRTSVEVTVNALPSISLSGSGAVDATHTYPWEWMTITATTSPSNLTVSWSDSFSGPTGGLETSMEEIGTPNHTYKVKSNRSLRSDQHTMNIDVTGTVTDDATGCSNSAMHRFYNNQVPAETCN